MNKNDFINNLIKLRKLDGTFKKTLFNEEYLITQSINQPLCSKNDLNKMKDTINKYLYKIFNSKEYQLKDNEINTMISIGMNYSDETKKLMKLPMSKIYDFIADKHNLCNNEINFYRLEINNIGIYTHFNKINDSLANYFDFDEIKQTRPCEDGLLISIFNISMQSSSRDYVSKFKFGCIDEKQIIKWFPKEMITHILEKAPNAKIVKYSIKERYIITSKQQMSYNSEHAVKQEEYSLYNFFNLSEINKKKKKMSV